MAATTAGVLAGGAIAAPVVGGIMGGHQAQKDRDQQRALIEQALAQYRGILPPSIEEQRLSLEGPEFIGEYSPEMEQFYELGPSSMEGISTDPRLQVAQMQALEQLSELGQTGLSQGDIAALRSVRGQVAGEEQARQGAILQEMARRGVAGGGTELAARLSSSQSAAQRQSEESDRMAQMAQARALQAITQGAGLAGQVRGQEFGEKTDVARARDIINATNIANQQSLAGRNVTATNQAQLRNIAEKQRLAEAAAATRNAEQQYNTQLGQQQFQNKMQLAGAKAGLYGTQASAAGEQAGRTGQMYAGIGQGVGTGLASLYNASSKPNTEEQDLNEINQRLSSQGYKTI